MSATRCSRRVERRARPLARLAACAGPDEGRLQAPRRIEVVAGPDHADVPTALRGRARAEVAPRRLDQARVCGLIGFERRWWLATHRHGGGEAFVPVDDPFAQTEQRVASGSSFVRASAAVVTPPEIHHRVGSKSHAGRAGHEGGGVRQRGGLRAPLGQETAERVVEAAGCCRGPDGLAIGGRAGYVAAVAACHAVANRRVEVARARLVGLGESVPEGTASTARPEEQSDGDADRAAQRDVLHPQQADPPAGRLHDVEEG